MYNNIIWRYIVFYKICFNWKEIIMKKRHSFKRLASMLLSASVVLSAVPAVFAADEDTAPVMTPSQAKAVDIPAFPGAEGGGSIRQAPEAARFIMLPI